MKNKKAVNVDEKASSILRSIGGISANNIQEKENKMNYNDEKRRVFKGVNIDKELYELLFKYAKENKLTFTSIVNEALEVYRRLNDIKKP